MPPLNDVVPRDLNTCPGSGPTGIDIQSAAKCYGLPYGVFGCISHFLTYYALIWLWSGRSPLPPWRKVSCKMFNIIIALVGSIVSTGVTAFTIVKCRNTWPFLLLAVWEACLSVLVGITGIHVARAIKKNGKPVHSVQSVPFQVTMDQAMTTIQIIASQIPRSIGGAGGSMWWIVIYFPGVIMGMIGLMFFVLQVLLHHEKDVTILTITFFVAVLAGTCMIALPCTRNCFLRKGSSLSGGKSSNQVPYPIWLACGFGGCMVLFAFLVAFYSDMALGLMIHNLFGLPHGDLQTVVVYWVYFAAGRLILFSF